MRRLAGIFIMLLLLVCACTTTKIVEVPVETIRTEHITDLRYDSVYVRDSVDRWIKGDTVYFYKEHTLYKYKDRTDTIMVTDTITKVVRAEVVKEVKVNELHWWQETLMWLGGILSLLVVLLVIHKLK